MSKASGKCRAGVALERCPCRDARNAASKLPPQCCQTIQRIQPDHLLGMVDLRLLQQKKITPTTSRHKPRQLFKQHFSNSATSQAHLPPHTLACTSLSSKHLSNSATSQPHLHQLIKQHLSNSATSQPHRHQLAKQHFSNAATSHPHLSQLIKQHVADKVSLRP